MRMLKSPVLLVPNRYTNQALWSVLTRKLLTHVLLWHSDFTFTVVGVVVISACLMCGWTSCLWPKSTVMQACFSALAILLWPANNPAEISEAFHYLHARRNPPFPLPLQPIAEAVVLYSLWGLSRLCLSGLWLTATRAIQEHVRHLFLATDCTLKLILRCEPRCDSGSQHTLRPIAITVSVRPHPIGKRWLDGRGAL